MLLVESTMQRVKSTMALVESTMARVESTIHGTSSLASQTLSLALNVGSVVNKVGVWGRRESGPRQYSIAGNFCEVPILRANNFVKIRSVKKYGFFFKLLHVKIDLFGSKKKLWRTFCNTLCTCQMHSPLPLVVVHGDFYILSNPTVNVMGISIGVRTVAHV